MSFRLKTILGIALIETLLLITLVVSSLTFLHDSNELQLRERAASTAKLFASATKDAVLATDLARLDSLVAEILDQSEVVYVRILDVDGMILAEGGDPDSLHRDHQPDIGIRTVEDGVFDTHITITEANIVFGRIELGLSTAAIHGVFKQALTWATTIAITEVVLVAFFSFLLGTYLTKGIRQLIHASATIRDHGPGYQSPVISNDEIGQATLAFNQMSTQLKNTYDALQKSLWKRDQTLLRSERNWAKNQAILTSSLDAIITVDGDGRVIDFNPAAESLFGWQANEVKGTAMDQFLIPPELREAHRRGMSHYLLTGKGPVLNKRIQLEAMHKAGHRIPVEVTISDTSTLEGPLFTAFLRDLTQHLADQTELRLAATAFETMQPILITDQHARIVRVNQAFTRITGYQPDEVIGHTPAMWASGKHDEAFYQKMWAELLAQGHWSGELYNKRKNGDLYPEWISISAVRDEAGNTTHYVANLIDMTEQKQREEALRQASEQAKQAEEAKGRFLAVMSHEIRTPLNAVTGVLDLLVDAPLDNRQQTLLKTGQESSRLLLTIINNILDFSKMEAGKFSLSTSPFDLHATLASSLELFRHQADHKGITLLLQTSARVPRFVQGDNARLQQILINLIGNALKFTAHGSIKLCSDATQDETGLWRFNCQVQDTGIGIAKEHRQQLFLEFSMVDQSHTRQTDGTGLGLVICKNLVELMGGEITVTSTPGVGSCFSFSIQLQPATEATLLASAQAVESNLEHPVNVLVAEDNPANRRVIEAMLDGSMAHLDLVEDGLKALQKVQANAYDMVLMDISMPHMDGISAAQAIRKLGDRFAQLPIIAMTAHHLDGDKERFLQAGMNDYLAKPMKKQELLSMISRWASVNQAQRGAPGDRHGAAPEPPSPRPTPQALVDEHVLQQLVRDTSAEIVPELLQGYIEDAWVRLDNILQAHSNNDTQQLEFETHTLGSSAASHGNQALFRAAREIEQLCREHDGETALARVVELEHLAKASLDALGQRIQQGFV